MTVGAALGAAARPAGGPARPAAVLALATVAEAVFWATAPLLPFRCYRRRPSSAGC
jgi:hypothetical protein